jgi:truncated hemoglobin YjbI
MVYEIDPLEYERVWPMQEEFDAWVEAMEQALEQGSELIEIPEIVLNPAAEYAV